MSYRSSLVVVLVVVVVVVAFPCLFHFITMYAVTALLCHCLSLAVVTFSLSRGNFGWCGKINRSLLDLTIRSVSEHHRIKATPILCYNHHLAVRLWYYHVEEMSVMAVLDSFYSPSHM